MLCFFQADCEFDVKFGADHEHHKCACKTGWTGNGVQVLMRILKNSEEVSNFLFIIFSNRQCFDSITGEASVEMVGTSRFKQHTDYYQAHFFLVF